MPVLAIYWPELGRIGREERWGRTMAAFTAKLTHESGD